MVQVVPARVEELSSRETKIFANTTMITKSEVPEPVSPDLEQEQEVLCVGTNSEVPCVNKEGETGPCVREKEGRARPRKKLLLC